MAVLTVIVTLLIVSCASAGGGGSDPEAVDWAGFTERGGLTIASAEQVGRLDAAVVFTLEGSSSDVDAAIEAAGFETTFSPGTDAVQAGLFKEDYDGLIDIESAVDTWKAPVDDLHPKQQTIHRHLVKGRRGGDVVLYASAFTT